MSLGSFMLPYYGCVVRILCGRCCCRHVLILFPHSLSLGVSIALVLALQFAITIFALWLNIIYSILRWFFACILYPCESTMQYKMLACFGLLFFLLIVHCTPTWLFFPPERCIRVCVCVYRVEFFTSICFMFVVCNGIGEEAHLLISFEWFFVELIYDSTQSSFFFFCRSFDDGPISIQLKHMQRVTPTKASSVYFMNRCCFRCCCQSSLLKALRGWRFH